MAPKKPKKSSKIKAVEVKPVLKKKVAQAKK